MAHAVCASKLSAGLGAMIIIERCVMCNCVKEIEAKALENLTATARYKKPVQGVSLKGVGFPIVGGKLLTRTCSDLEVKLDGQKKVERMTMFHTFCPYCGTKYESA